jgi:hypothetical protein
MYCESRNIDVVINGDWALGILSFQGSAWERPLGMLSFQGSAWERPLCEALPRFAAEGRAF